MAIPHGKGTVVLWNGFNLSPYLKSAGLELLAETADVSTFGDTWRKSIPGVKAASFTADGFYDPAIVDDLAGALGVDAGVLTYCPGAGSAYGDVAFTASIIATSLGLSAVVDDAVAFSWECLPSGAVEVGVVHHALAEDTNTTTGTARDGGAATATGWTAQLHVSAVDAGSWVVTIEDSADGSTGWAVIGTFTAATGATTQRLTSAATTTAVRRYTRYVATRTGGAGGDGITFALAFSRSRAQ